VVRRRDTQWLYRSGPAARQRQGPPWRKADRVFGG